MRPVSTHAVVRGAARHSLPCGRGRGGRMAEHTLKRVGRSEPTFRLRLAGTSETRLVEGAGEETAEDGHAPPTQLIVEDWKGHAPPPQLIGESAAAPTQLIGTQDAETDFAPPTQLLAG